MSDASNRSIIRQAMVDYLLATYEETLTYPLGTVTEETNRVLDVVAEGIRNTNSASGSNHVHPLSSIYDVLVTADTLNRALYGAARTVSAIALNLLTAGSGSNADQYHTHSGVSGDFLRRDGTTEVTDDWIIAKHNLDTNQIFKVTAGKFNNFRFREGYHNLYQTFVDEGGLSSSGVVVGDPNTNEVITTGVLPPEAIRITGTTDVLLPMDYTVTVRKTAARASGSYFFNSEGQSYIKIVGGNIYGSSDVLSWGYNDSSDHCIKLVNCSYVWITGARLFNFSGSNIYLENCSHVIIDQCVLANPLIQESPQIGRANIEIVGDCSNITISNNVLLGGNPGSITLGGSATGSISKVNIVDNFIDGYGAEFEEIEGVPTYSSGIYLDASQGDLSNISIRDNIIAHHSGSSTTGYGVLGVTLNDNTITDLDISNNYVFYCDQNGINLEGDVSGSINRLTVFKNTIYGNGGQAVGDSSGLYLNLADLSTIAHNYILNTTASQDYGITAIYTTNLVVYSNLVTNHTIDNYLFTGSSSSGDLFSYQGRIGLGCIPEVPIDILVQGRRTLIDGGLLTLYSASTSTNTSLDYDKLYGVTGGPTVNADLFHTHNFSTGSGGGGGVSVHGQLQGLDADDHHQYLLADGSRDLSDTWRVTHDIVLSTGSLGLGTEPSGSNSVYALGLIRSDEGFNYQGTFGISLSTATCVVSLKIVDGILQMLPAVRAWGGGILTSYVTGSWTNVV